MKPIDKAVAAGLVITKEPSKELSEWIAKTQPVHFFWEFSEFLRPLIEALYAYDTYKNPTRLIKWLMQRLSPEDFIDLVNETYWARRNKDRTRLIDWLAQKFEPEEMTHIENFLTRHITTKKPPQPSYLMHPKEVLARRVRDRIADMIHWGEARDEREAKPKAIDEILAKFSQFPQMRVDRRAFIRYFAHNSGHSREDHSGPDRPTYPPTKKARRRDGSKRAR